MLDGSIHLVFGDEERRFRLGMAQLLTLEEKCDSAFAELHDRLMEGRWSVTDVTETLRLGLVGADVDPREAKALVERYATPGHLEPASVVAFYVVAAALNAPKTYAKLGKAVTAGGADGAASASPPPLSTETASS